MSVNIVSVMLMIVMLPPAAAEWPLGELVPSTPGGDYVLIGQQLLLDCHLNSSTTYNSGMLFVEKGDDFNGSLTIIDSRTAEMNLTVTSLSDAGRYYCWVGVSGEGSSLFVGSRLVEVEYYPEPVVNITCVKYNWDEKMNCTWDLGVNYVNASNIEVSFFYQTRRGDNDTDVTRGKRCPNQTQTGCYFTRYNFPSLKYVVRVKNKRTNEPVNGRPIFSKCNDLVKPDPINVINVNTTKTNFTLVWNHNKRLRAKMYRFRFHKVGDADWKEVLKKPAPDFEEEPPSMSQTVVGLRPYTLYEVEMDTRPTPTTGYWSDKVTRTKRTLEDVPATGPHTTPGSFYSEVCHSNIHDVTVFWQEPSAADRNGKITRYLMDYNGIRSRLDAAEFQFTAPSLPCDKRQVISLDAETSVGASGNPSLIVVPPTSQGSNIQDFDIVVSDREVKAMWKPHEGEVTDLYVYWCVGSRIRKKCEKPLKWAPVGVNRTSFEIPDLKVVVDEYLFGLSAVIDNVTTGITWAECIVEKGARPTETPMGLQVEKTASPTSLKLKWPKTRCIDTALITNYRLYVGEVSGKNIINKYNITYNLTTAQHVATELQAGRNYSFRLQAVSSAGVGPINDPIYQAIPSERGYLHLREGIAVAVVIGVIMLAVIVVIYMYRKRKQCWAKETISLPKWTSPYSSPSHEMLRSDTSCSGSSSLDATNQTKATEEDVICSGSSNSTRTNSDTNMHGIQNGILSGQTTGLKLTSDPDQIQVVINPNESYVQNGITYCPDYKKIGDMEPMHGNRPSENYSLFSDAGLVDARQNHLPCSPEEDQVVHNKDVAVHSINPMSPYVKTTLGNVAPAFHPNYVQEQQVTDGVPCVKTISAEVNHPNYLSNTSPPVILNADYVQVPLVNACKEEASDNSRSRSENSGSRLSNSRSRSDTSRSTSDSMDAYMRAGLGSDDVQTSPESPTHPDYVSGVPAAGPAVLPLEEHALEEIHRDGASLHKPPPAGMEVNPDYISITDNCTKL
ncbi:interleukin-6 receptor subunit beta-like isoform X1 [Haliotis rufescens]|uniref:interleukin-6 receptor subunit beta-like isoform X1 n=1 Tax=Haliotis rufescens TaxID=6454 RepID=UPI00201FA129|nr:interleukin-6 receptor subunit beta-like isoform X1 [Haliotis rufescens]XP_046331519.2 interleukin-6 receptor subunit beta-like isoform X1 [Haliotis rufescens]